MSKSHNLNLVKDLMRNSNLAQNYDFCSDITSSDKKQVFKLSGSKMIEKVKNPDSTRKNYTFAL